MRQGRTKQAAMLLCDLAIILRYEAREAAEPRAQSADAFVRRSGTSSPAKAEIPVDRDDG